MKKVSFKLENRITILLIILLLFLLLIIGATCYAVYKSKCKSSTNNVDAKEIVSGYYCKKQKCHRIRNANSSNKIMGLSTCFLTCIPGGTLWPITKFYSIDENVEHIDKNEIEFINIKDNEFLENFKLRFYKNLDQKISNDQIINKNGGKLEIYVNIINENILNAIYENENYVIKIGKPYILQATIVADSYFGARHGLETLLNLIVQDELTNKLVYIFLPFKIPRKVLISDEPHYMHRGLLIDTINNYIPIKNIKKTIDAMSRVKLNVLHWYIGGAQSFPLYIHKQPKLNQLGCYSEKKIYTSQNIIDVINFAKLRAIRVMPEFDTPANIGAGWDNINVTIKCESNQFGQFDLTNEQLYPILDDIFGEIYENFQQPDLIHLGGRNVSIECWNSSQVTANSEKKLIFESIDENYYIEYWTKYLEKIVKFYEKLNPQQKFIIWKETFDKNPKARDILSPENVIIQIGDNFTYNDNQSNYLYITSKLLNIDFTNWRDYYQDLCSSDITIVGAEALLWTQFENNLDQKLWPKLSAIAEKLWINSNRNDHHNKNYLKLRLLYHRSVLVKYGIRADTIASEWCLQNMAECNELYT